MRALLFVATFCFFLIPGIQAGVASYSGVYNASFDYGKYSAKLVFGFTRKGYLTGGIYYSKTSSGSTTYVSLDQFKPSLSKVSSDGSFSGKTLNGNKLSGTITIDDDSTTFSGKLIIDDVSIPIKGTRIYE